jgi:nitric oxide reductase subunit B
VRYAKLWAALTTVIVASFAVLGYYGWQIYHVAPPIPAIVATPDGRVLFTAQTIRDGQNIWQSIGGQEVGSVWGHGAYVAPDWSADWLHRESTWLLDTWATRRHGKPFAQLTPEEQAVLKVALKREMRTNTYDPASGRLTVSADRAAAIAAVAGHYTALFGRDPAQQALRQAYAMPAGLIKDPARQMAMNAFFFWTSWACATNRPGQTLSYTSNWPPEPLVDNAPTGQMIIWSVLSFIALLAGVGGLAWYYAVQNRRREEDDHVVPEDDPLLAIRPTPSMQATLKYFWVVGALVVTQMLLGVITAHYGVEGGGFYGIPLDRWLPYPVTRTWHLQLGIFWIATAWLATGLYIAPAVSGREPPWQRFGVNALFGCLLVIVAGSLAGEWLGVQQRLSLTGNFWFGHQGYEYVDLGRFWQAFLWVGLFLWLGLLGRALWPALRGRTESKDLLVLFGISSAAIAIFYTPGLFWGRQTHLAVSEYWRWWVVHLWVEGFFEVFATTVIAFLFTRMGLVQTRTATRAVLFSTTVFLAGGILGTFHHLYFSGTTIPVMALGATFSALEVVPLVLIGFEAYENYRAVGERPWVEAYRWPIYFFVAVAFWNLLGAGLFGFLINPPIALYYMQGLNTTAVHGHTALFGVYGMLGLGLMLFCLKGLTVHHVWRTGAIKLSFWAINVGLLLMVVISVLPVGLMQTWASVEHGYWMARSAEFLQTPTMALFRWLRVVGDTIFAIGILAMGWFVVGLKTGWSVSEADDPLWRVPIRLPEAERGAHRRP